MERVGARPADVARATSLHASTIIRIRDKEQVPDGATMLKLNRWAGEAARAVGLRDGEGLEWEYLVDAESAAG